MILSYLQERLEKVQAEKEDKRKNNKKCIKTRMETGMTDKWDKAKEEIKKIDDLISRRRRQLGTVCNTCVSCCCTHYNEDDPEAEFWCELTRADVPEPKANGCRFWEGV